jgi:hypothetical protein
MILRLRRIACSSSATAISGEARPFREGVVEIIFVLPCHAAGR